MENQPHSPSCFGVQIPKLKRPGATSKPAAETAETPDDAGPSKSWRDRLPRGWPYWLVGLGVAGVFVFALRPTPIAVDLGTVEEGTLQVTVDAEGKTRVQNRYIVAAPVAGRLSRIELESGDSIEAGAVVARIDSLPFNSEVQAAQARLRELEAQIAGVETQRPKDAALAQAEADINAAIARQRQAEARYQEAQASLSQAQRERDRAQELQAAGAISRQDREAAELTATRRQQEVEAAQRQVDAERANVAAARNALGVLQAEQQDPDYLLDVYRAQIASTEAELLRLTDEAQRTTVTAPAAGSVLQVMQKSARFVQAGEPLIEVGNADQLELVIDILSTDAVSVEPGALIQIEQWGGEESLQARVRYVEPSAFTEVSALGVEEQRVNVIADFVDPPVALGDGYRVEAQIVTWAAENVMIVPISALFRCDSQTWCTFVSADGKAQQREIVISQRNDLAAAVESGLVPGEQVILHPSEEIEAEKRVRVRE
ncbi:HlyD family efflux transporter periplasmic adaptor subunit [Romeria aff. gracilis LEGE 07310]|uniref:HlyD family efflux transporter periplasmic adaptor subunit n=1 Tax=Vasconcelosia minhoensis LEGE 07310 TaxID=915328 RepID=A0A8J7AUK4_9CYAN|nr:HlyD family efflux transporter periplasmic adaptor subunit [Romeria gracilis]MBE9079644.1 HlyD family efflux transporter periplasmic adaptor subunit [Romeria aff. gracilis LEGE 07310]